MSAFGQRGRQFFNKNNNNDDTKKRAGTTKWSDVRTQCLVQKYGLFPSLVPTSDNIMKSLNGDNCEWLRRPGYAASFLGQDLKELCDSFDNMTNLINNEYVTGVLRPLRTLIIESDAAKIIQPIGNSVTQFQDSEIEDDEEEVATAMYTFTTELCNWAMLRPDGHADSAGMIKEMEALLECITPLANLCVDILIYLSILDHGSDYVLKGDAQLANNEYFNELKKGTGDVTTMSQYFAACAHAQCKARKVGKEVARKQTTRSGIKSAFGTPTSPVSGRSSHGGIAAAVAASQQSLVSSPTFGNLSQVFARSDRKKKDVSVNLDFVSAKKPRLSATSFNSAEEYMNSMSPDEKKALIEAAGVLGMHVRQLLEHQLEQQGAATSSTPSPLSRITTGLKSTPSKPSTVLPQAKQWSDTEEVDAESSSSSDGASDVAKKDVSAVTVPPLPEGIQERTKARVAALNAGLLETPADKATTSTNGTKVSSTTGKASPTGNKAKRAAKGKGRRGKESTESAST